MYGKPVSIISCFDSLKSRTSGLKTSRIVRLRWFGIQPIDFKAATMVLVGSVILLPVNSPVIVLTFTSAHSGDVALKKDSIVSNNLNKIRSPLDKDPDAIPPFTRRQSTFTRIGKHIGNPENEERERLPR
jgi:hypothetical protein